ncbi:MAG: hypothetical protein BGP06_07450 [Rhizobiales bacterium 65-9]|nr:hypothetical protein [Hyphomicrobiales bacterium]OJY35644.1 MAG: hypothetical protein BGP06_07450 [Rhizobiales bacterium 65-9]
MKSGAIPAVAAALLLTACGPRPQLAEPAPSAPVAQAPAPATPSIFISAPGQRVRSVIAARAQARGTTVASNTSQGVVLERALPQSTETLEAQCGPHVSGRMIRVILSTQERPGGTTVSENRYIVDGSAVCPVTLTPEEVTQANAALAETRDQVLGIAARAPATSVAPATPRT